MTGNKHYGSPRAGPVAVLAVVAYLAAAVVAVGQPAALSLDPSTGSFDCDEAYVVDLVVDAAAPDLRGFSIVLGFDSDVIEPISVTAGDLLTGAACDYFFSLLEPTEADSISVDAAALGCSISGPGVLVRIVFGGVAQGSTTLDCVDVRLRDGNNAPVAFTCAPAAIEYTCPVSAERTRWGELKSRFR